MNVSEDIAFISFANGSRDKVSICAKDLSTGEVLMTFMGGTIARATLNLIGSRYLLAADEHKAVIYLWSLNKMYPIKTIKAVGKISCLSVSNSSCVCVGSVDERLYVWMVHTGELIRSVGYHCTRITCIKFSTSGMDFVTCDKHGSVALWNATRLMSVDTKMGNQPVMTFTGHSAKVTDAHLDETYLVTGSLDKTARVWFLRTGELYRCVDFEGAVTSVAISPSLGRLLVGFNEARLAVIDVAKESRTSEATFVVNSDVVCTGWSSEGVFIYGDDRGTVGVLHPDTSYCDELLVHNAAITNIVLVPFLPHGWNDASKPSLLDITPFSDKMCHDPVNLGAPVNFQTLQVESCKTAERMQPLLVESKEIKNVHHDNVVNVNQEKNQTQRNNDSNKNNTVIDSTILRTKEQYSSVLNNLLLE